MRLTLVVAAVAVVAGSCSAAPSNVAPIGPGTTAPVTVDAPVISPPTDLPTLGLQLVTNGPPSRWRWFFAAGTTGSS